MALKVEVIRPDDLVHLQIEAHNLRLDSANPDEPVLVVADANLPAYLIVDFPPQTIAETAYFASALVPPEGDPQRPDPDKTAPSEPLDMPGEVRPPRRSAAQLGRHSRLVFKVAKSARLPFSTAGLLDWSTLDLSVNAIAAVPAKPTAEQIAQAPGIQAPTATETAIELPYRLVISPNDAAAWRHRSRPFTARGRTELWHTRLVLKTPAGISELSHDQHAPLRAIWSPDYHADKDSPSKVPLANQTDPDLGRTAMSANDRHQIVVLTSAFHGYEVERDFFFLNGAAAFDAALLLAPGRAGIKWTVPYVPQPFEAEQLMLSPLGGWLRSRGQWTPPHTAAPVLHRPMDVNQLFKPLASPRTPPAEVARAAVAKPDGYQLDLSEWAHIATQGRDHYVRIVYEGELWPFRHRASLIKVTERKFMQNNGIIGAYLLQRMFIVVREPLKTFARDNRGMPFKRVQLTTRITPDIALPNYLSPANRSFWVEVTTPGRVFFKFHGLGTDVAGNTVDFTVPLLFVSLSSVNDANLRKEVATTYNAVKYITLRTVNVPGQKVTFAEADADPARRNDNTHLVTETMNFIVNAAGDPPQLLKAQVKIPQVQELLGTDALTTIRLFKDYVAGGFDAGTGVFAEIVKENLAKFTDADPGAALEADKLGVPFSADKAGGFATPNLGVSTLTRALGPLAGDVKKAVSNAFDPGEFFPKNSAMIFGTFDLMQLLPTATLDQNAPKLRTQTQDIAGGKLLVTTLDWTPGFSGFDAGIAAISKEAAGSLTIHGKIEKPVKADGVSAAPTFRFTGTLTHFVVSVLKSVYINFTEFSFTAEANHKPDVTVHLDLAKPVEFAGDLKFIEELRKAIPPDLFGSGPSLDLSPTGIRAGFAFALPPLSVGVFALKDVSLGAALTLPFLSGKPTFDFNVSERHHPFLLSVSLFAGGGFFHLQLDTAGFKELEVALEFGAAAALELGVASGEVHIMAGIYFSLQRKENSTALTAVLTGYLRAGGSLSVLGLIKITVEFNLSFTYDSGRDKAYGRATLTVQVEVAFFSKSVELTVERAFGGSGDPNFRDMFNTADRWRDYALAYA